MAKVELERNRCAVDRVITNNNAGFAPRKRRLYSVHPLHGIPEVRKDDDIAGLIIRALGSAGESLAKNDVVVVKQKIVSKAEGRVVRLEGVKPSRRAVRIASDLGKEAQLVELILRESRRIVRMGHGGIITETKHGFVCANSGIDRSNVQSGHAALLPLNPDRSARRIRRTLEKVVGARLSVVITDTFGRPWRNGQPDVTIGSSGIEPLQSYRGRVDAYGYTLRVTEPAIVDEIGSAAELAMGKLSAVPVAIANGLKYRLSGMAAKRLLMPREKDLFR